MEKIEQQTALSENQQEKVVELLGIVKPLYDSFTESDDAYDTAEKMNYFYESLKGKGLNPKGYYLWSLLTPDSTSVNLTEFDTPDGDIEKFIRGLQNEQEETLAA